MNATNDFINTIRDNPDDLTSLRLANHRLSALVEAADIHVRELESVRDKLQRQCDAMAREVADLRDARHATAAKQALDWLQRVMATLASSTEGPAVTSIHNGARAFLVEKGRRAPEMDAMIAASERFAVREP
jgi:hypothetical protein